MGTYFNIEEDAFFEGTVAIRHGLHYFHTAEPWADRSKLGYRVDDMNLIHQSKLDLINREELSFRLNCRSDSYGALIEQKPPQAKLVAKVATKSCAADQVSFEIPELPAGKYKVAFFNPLGQATGSI